MKKYVLILLCVCLLTSACLAQATMKVGEIKAAGGYTKVAVTDKEVTHAGKSETWEMVVYRDHFTGAKKK